ncbi:glycoside hydrolase [Hyaloraphidium curvatum]|nr:glycoside hydrolase [Hyaloraphidium curvatum]
MLLTILVAMTIQTLGAFFHRGPPQLVRRVESVWRPPMAGDLGGPEGEFIAKKARWIVKRMAEESWKAYKTYAKGMDDLQPASRSGRNWYPGGSLLITPIDALSTFHLMGMTTEFAEARELVASASFDIPSHVSFFEITIRCLAGLLSAYESTGRSDQVFLEKAVDLANRLIPAFDPNTGLPWRLVSLSTGERKDSNNVPIAELASFQLEFFYLADVTGNCSYADYAYRVNDVLWTLKDQISESPDHVTDLFPFDLNPSTLKLGNSGILSVGGGVDSFYEYLLKMYIQLDRKDPRLWGFFQDSVDAMLTHLAVTVRFENDRFHHGFSKGHYNATLGRVLLDGSMEHLSCMFGGTLALASEFGAFTDQAKRDRYWTWAQRITETCMQSYIDSRCGLGAEIFNLTVQPIRPRESSGGSERVYILRPETAESAFYLHRYTREKKYRDWAWRTIQVPLHPRVLWLLLIRHAHVRP